jgi:hypothetical protein
LLEGQNALHIVALLFLAADGIDDRGFDAEEWK